MGMSSSQEENCEKGPVKSEEINIMLIGCGEVGKTTFFRQIELLLHKFRESELEEERIVVVSNILNFFMEVNRYITTNKIPFSHLENKV
jgi:stage III sporulation protein SpoIIIAA